MTREEFSRWHSSQALRCAYCDLDNLKMSENLSGGRKLLTFTIDRMDSALPYSPENMSFACWGCNRLKSNVFSYSEFREIAQKYLKPKWCKIGS